MDLKYNHDSLLEKKKLRFKIVEEQSKLTTSDPEFDKVYRWLKYNSEWFIREVPQVGRGLPLAIQIIHGGLVVIANMPLKDTFLSDSLILFNQTSN